MSKSEWVKKRSASECNWYIDGTRIKIIYCVLKRFWQWTFLRCFTENIRSAFFLSFERTRRIWFILFNITYVTLMLFVASYEVKFIFTLQSYILLEGILSYYLEWSKICMVAAHFLDVIVYIFCCFYSKNIILNAGFLREAFLNYLDLNLT